VAAAERAGLNKAHVVTDTPEPEVEPGQQIELRPELEPADLNEPDGREERAVYGAGQEAELAPLNCDLPKLPVKRATVASCDLRKAFSDDRPWLPSEIPRQPPQDARPPAVDLAPLPLAAAAAAALLAPAGGPLPPRTHDEMSEDAVDRRQVRGWLENVLYDCGTASSSIGNCYQMCYREIPNQTEPVRRRSLPDGSAYMPQRRTRRELPASRRSRLELVCICKRERATWQDRSIGWPPRML
jgi:hypothetical protein